MARIGAGLALICIILAVVLFGVLSQMLSTVGEARVYHDLSAWILMVTVLVGLAVLARVVLTGIAKVTVSRHAHKAQPVQRETVIRERVLDGRISHAPQLINVERPANFGSLFPDMARAAMQSIAPGQTEGLQTYDVTESSDVWAGLSELFSD